jgi:3-hydroxybutyryl-CoA dehydratase
LHQEKKSMPVNLNWGPYFNELKAEAQFQSSLTVTETHIVLACGLFGDFNPVHMNAEYAKNTRFERPLAPGTLTIGIMGSALGNYFAGTAIANTGINATFKAPVQAGDTITTTWTIVRLEEKPKLKGGIAYLTGQCVNQQGQVVVEAESTVAVRSQE